MTHRIRRLALGLAILAPLASGCGAKVEKTANAAESAPKPVSITVSDLQRKPVERSVEVVGTLRGWEEVTVGAKKAGRVVKVFHDFGDSVAPGEPLVQLDPVDARLGILQAETRFLSELARLGITRKQAEEYLAKFGMGEKILTGEDVDRRIREIPAVVQARVSLERMQQNFARQKQLAVRNAGTVQELQNAENDLDGARAAFDNAIVTARSTLASSLASKVALDQAQQTLDDLTIRAPVPSKPPLGEPADAVSFAITRRQVHEGQMVKEGESLLDLVIRTPLRLWANVPERFSSEIQPGQEVRIAVSSHPGEVFRGEVRRINPSVDSTSRTFQVEAVIPNVKGLLRPGGFAKASILTRKDAEAAVVPIQTVVKFAGVTKIFVVENDKARAIPVETGLEGKDWIEVRGDLPSRALVVTDGQSVLADGTPVAVRKPPAKAETSAATPKVEEAKP